jgi:hypothetical protein
MEIHMTMDIAGIETGLADKAALSAWNGVIENVLAHAATTATNLGDVLRLAPTFAPAHAVKGFALHMLGRREMDGAARDALAQARLALRQSKSDVRSRGLVEALELALDGRDGAAAQRLEAILFTHPTDALSLKLGHALRFMVGDAAGMRAASDQFFNGFDRSHALAGYVFGMRAFALEETGDPVGAEGFGHAAVSLSPRDAWGRHAVAHVHEATGRSVDARTWLSDESTWAHTNNFGFHMFWHRALAALDCGAVDEVLALYDARIRAEKTDDFRDVANAASLLTRLELDGVDVGARWDELGTIARRRVVDGRLVFADLHHALSLVGLGDADGLEAIAMGIASRSQGSTPSDTRASTFGAPTAFGLLAFREGDYAEAARLLLIGAPGLSSVGGSNAQRDVFEQMLIESLIRAGRLDEATKRLEARLSQRNGHNRFAETRLQRIAGRDLAGRTAALVAATLPLSAHH